MFQGYVGFMVENEMENELETVDGGHLAAPYMEQLRSLVWVGVF